jgi:DNA (cytosine-5)-methyltransferase 1
MKILDTFAGIGGFSYAAEKLIGGFETTQFIEIDPFCQKVLKKHWPHVPIHDDIKTFTAKPFQYQVICGGFPCQDISVAGLQKGITEETRSGLFFELMRVIRMVRPQYVVLENVAAIINRGLDIVLRELSEAGYDAEWSVIRASSVGACHQRSRWWLVAYPNDNGQQERWFETRNQVITRKNSQSKWSTNTSDFKRQSDDENDQRQSRTDENLSESSDGGKTISTTTGRLCDLSKETNNNQGTSRENNNQKNNDRTLVSEGQSRFQLSKCRELGRDKTTFKGDSIRYGDDNSRNERVDNQESNVTYPNNDGSSSAEKCRLYDKASNRTQKRKDKSSQLEGSCESSNSGFIQSSSEFTNSYSKGVERRKFTIPKKLQNAAYTWQSNTPHLSPEWQSYVSESVLCRGDDGLRNRVDRLRALGNSVVPQCAAIPLQRVKDLYEATS